ncbi:MAG TPA: chemotaxis protein CheB [Candidatus Acidoferrales bacterium]|nr:chemotaxis protein CheB [Candidatus Acidoferrales bacterium]
MQNRDIIVIGGSAGGVEALKTVFSALPRDLPASVFAVLHTTPHTPNLLPTLLSGVTELRTKGAADGEPIEHGRAYIAQPDRHLLVANSHVHLSAGPKENRTRPAINPLFRSAAISYGPRVIGVILTGTLDDGTLGLWEIKRRGGVAVVQDPKDAQHDQMPISAIQNVEIDFRVPLNEISPLLVSLVRGQIPRGKEAPQFPMHSQPTRLTCPECHGPIERRTFGNITELVCRVGHSYSPESMLVAHDEAEERALWTAVQMLEEGAELADQSGGTQTAESPLELHRTSSRKRDLAKRIREVIELNGRVAEQRKKVAGK